MNTIYNTMNRLILNELCYFLPTPEKLLNSCKKFTIQRIYNIRWKNRVYFIDNRIKMKNSRFIKVPWIINTTIWYKDGKIHRDDIVPETGFVLPAVIDDVKHKRWYKDGKENREDIDPDTGFTLPTIIQKNYSKDWYKNGNEHRCDIDPETGLTLPSVIRGDNLKYWYKAGVLHRIEIDPDTGFTLPAVIYYPGEEEWHKDGKLHRNDIDPETCFYLPAEIDLEFEIKKWYLNGTEFFEKN
jgi:hypothetical protein